MFFVFEQVIPAGECDEHIVFHLELNPLRTFEVCKLYIPYGILLIYRLTVGVRPYLNLRGRVVFVRKPVEFPAAAVVDIVVALGVYIVEDERFGELLPSQLVEVVLADNPAIVVCIYYSVWQVYSVWVVVMIEVKYLCRVQFTSGTVHLWHERQAHHGLNALTAL